MVKTMLVIGAIVNINLMLSTWKNMKMANHIIVQNTQQYNPKIRWTGLLQT